MRIPHVITSLAMCLLASGAWANDNVVQANMDSRTMLGVAGHPAQLGDLFTHSNGAYICRNSVTRGTPHVARFPFALPDTRALIGVAVQGKRTSSAPPMTLSVRKVCEGLGEVTPGPTVLATATPVPDANGFFQTVLAAGDTDPSTGICKYWVQAEFNISSVNCMAGDAWIQKITAFNMVRDRIFRGSFHTNVTQDTP